MTHTLPCPCAHSLTLSLPTHRAHSSTLPPSLHPSPLARPTPPVHHFPTPSLNAPSTQRGDPCFVTDCVFNIEVARNAAQDRRLKQFVIELCLGWAGQKHKLSLDPKFKLPKILYKGSQVEAQRMRVDKKPMVTEIKVCG